MRLYQRKGIYHVEFSLPSGGRPKRQSTHERDQRQARAKAHAIEEAAIREWSRQEDLFGSRDTYVWESAVADWNRERMKQGLAIATIEFDGQNLRYLAAAKDTDGRSFFAGRLIREINGPTVEHYIAQQVALGLVHETVSKRLSTLRQVLEHARARKGTDGRQLLSELPRIPSLAPSRDDSGWGRAIDYDTEWEPLRLAFPTCDIEAPGLRLKIWDLATRYPSVTASDVADETHATMESVRSALSRASNPGAPGFFLRRLRVPLCHGGRGAPLRRYARAFEALPRAPLAAVDQRGWVEICVWTGEHTADVNSFTPDLFNLGPGPGSPPHRLPAGTFLWRNSKNRQRTRGKIRDQVRALPAELTACLERLAAVRGLRDGAPVAGNWLRGNIHRDMTLAARRAGLQPVIDDRGRPHLLSANDLRRTAATWIAEQLAAHGSGPDKSAIEVIAEFLGHRGIEVARRIYDRSAGARLGVVVSMLDSLKGRRKAPAALPAISHIGPAAARERK